ncbi:mRNA cap guanine-N7 methyltransferase-like [Panonychus citri]|uniref:mRNA cap guanine-N7 methyltransferase-like n=1 Tax=Panonychus citri TaxID=50023 RepID=UPI002307073D|nr:mRNA cap guanine-N7 methyltransferase-like [Panonychus citri]
MNSQKRKAENHEDAPEPKLSKVIATHYNRIEEKGIESRKESRIYYLRNFNNWVKAVIIAQALTKIQTMNERKDIRNKSVTVLDIGCGKGGDLRKYRIHGVANLVCVDIADESLAQCRDRYREMTKLRHKGNLFDAFFIHADCTRDNLNIKYKETKGLVEKLGDKNQFDLVSCQFTFHYCFESLAQAETMIKNIANNLKKDGLFIGTTPDANYIVAKARKEGASFGNEVYSVTFKDESITDKNKIVPLFGVQYNFHLEGCVDCPEFLVHFPTFEKIAEKYGLKLAFARRFEDFYAENHKKDEEAGLLSRMGALETFPPGDEPLKGSDDDYIHAEQFFNYYRKEKKLERIGTLSQSEWEAINLYLVFAFIKV